MGYGLEDHSAKQYLITDADSFPTHRMIATDRGSAVKAIVGNRHIHMTDTMTLVLGGDSNMVTLKEIDTAELACVEGGVSPLAHALVHLAIHVIDDLTGCLFAKIPEARHLCD